MADLIVIYDPEREVAAVVNMDTATAVGPTMIGTEAADILQAWLDATPFDVSWMAPTDAVHAFGLFLDRMGNALEVAPDTPDNGAVVETPPTDVADADALAEAEAANASGVPPAQPADTDGETPADTVTREVRCFNCNGAGMIEFGDDSPAQRCGMCGGTGKITETVTA